MEIIWIATGLLAVFAFLFMKERIKGHSIKDVILKVCCSACLLTVAAMAMSINRTSYGIILFLGVLMGCTGDLFLGLSHLNKEHKRKNLLTGIIDFGLGHVMFCVAVILAYIDSVHMLHILIPFMVAVVLAVSICTLRRKLGLHFGRYLPAVMIYLFLLSFSVFLAISLNIAVAWSSLQMKIFGLGMIFFIISDSIISRMYFGKIGNSPKAVISNHVTYYLAEWLIAFSILFM